MAMVDCGECGFKKEVKEDYLGKRVKCPSCKQSTTVIASGSTAPEPVKATTRRPSTEQTRYSLDDFLAKTKQKDQGQGLFELESDRILELNVDGNVWLKTGAMISYRGKVKFVRERILEFGLKKALFKFFTSEGSTLTKASGRGKVYCADQGKKITILNLDDDVLYVNGNDVLAFEESLEWNVKMIKSVGAMFSGGLFNMRIEGTGLLAISTHYDPMSLEVDNAGITTDPNATVAWSGGLEPSIKTDFQLKTLVGRGSGETIQLHFKGHGFVVVQPFEESPFETVSQGAGSGRSAPPKALSLLFSGLIFVLYVVYYVFFGK